MSEESEIQSSKSKTAFVFPGQGSQAVGMGKSLYDNFAVAREVFDEADEALGFSLSEMCFAGTEEELALTANTQPAILTVSIAAFRVIESEGLPLPDFVAGHSLGEYSALVASGAMSFHDAVCAVRKRGTYMQEAVPVGAGAMAAILGLALETVEEACAEAAGDQICAPANINSPNQIVIAGESSAVDRSIELLKTRGARKAVKLNVSAPFHCRLMMPAQEKLAVDLARIEFHDLRFPIVENVSAQLNTHAERVPLALTEQVSNPVRWAPSIEKLIGEGVETFVEVGNGKVLAGLIRQITREVRSLSVESPESLENTKQSLLN